jgi:serine/threonine protein kinase
MGVIAYALLCGYMPFYSEVSQDELFAAIVKGSFEFDSPYWDGISEDAKDFVAKMLYLPFPFL